MIWSACGDGVDMFRVGRSFLSLEGHKMSDSQFLCHFVDCCFSVTVLHELTQ